jgi:ABC-type multidrug transport system ATPase subunit
MITLTAQHISKSYGQRRVITDRSLVLSGGEQIGLIGPNGSGKSTMLRILAGLQRPDTGTLTLTVGNATYDREAIPQHAGLVAPYLNVWDEFTPTELLGLQARLRASLRDSREREREFEVTLERVGLIDRRNDAVRTFSSGLRQRCLLALAVHWEPEVLYLDEPTITLDEVGKRIVEAEIASRSARGGIVVIATNDERERQLCTRLIELG